MAGTSLRRRWCNSRCGPGTRRRCPPRTSWQVLTRESRRRSARESSRIRSRSSTDWWGRRSAGRRSCGPKGTCRHAAGLAPQSTEGGRRIADARRCTFRAAVRQTDVEVGHRSKREAGRTVADARRRIGAAEDPTHFTPDTRDRFRGKFTATPPEDTVPLTLSIFC